MLRTGAAERDSTPTPGAYAGSDPLLTQVDYRLVISLAIGLLIGLERERRKGEGASRAEAGIRTFALVGLLGGVCALFGQWFVLAGLVGIAVLAAIAYYAARREDPGITTEVALLVTFLLGALAEADPMRAALFGVVVAVVLALRTRLHRFVKSVLTEEEFHDGLVFAAAAFVVLPLLPDRALGPFGAINPRMLWRLVVLVMGVSAAGHVGTRALGPTRGLAMTGFASGFVSASATIGAMGERATKDPTQARPAIAAAVISTVSTFVQLALVTAATSAAVTRALALPIAFGGVTALVVAYFVSRNVGSAPPAKERGHAFSLKSALAFAAVVSVALFFAAAARAWLGRSGLWLGAALAGFADAHAAAISLASLVAAGEAQPGEVTAPIMLGVTTNTLTKLVIARTSGGAAFANRVGLGLALVLGMAWLGMVVAHVWG